MNDRTVLVVVDIDHHPILAGRLHMRARRGRQSASFEYDARWLSYPGRFALDPVYLPLGKGTFHTTGGQVLFPGLSDSAPDRWGRVLMTRQARLAGSGRTLFESDYLLMVDDQTRQGALRFQEVAGGGFLASSGDPIPPLVALGKLLVASDKVQDDEADLDALQVLLAPGSSLGGARPKASVLDGRGRLAIAKFPATTDQWPVIVWEQVAVTLAAKAGIDVPETELIDVAARRVLLTQRFDRRGDRRVPFLSALALIGAADREGDHSYLEIADAIRQHGQDVARNLRELWRRMIFNVLISNTDDHLRNHGLLRAAEGWILSPAYDLNPVPVDVKPRIHALALDDSSAEASLDTVVGVANYFGIERRAAARIIGEVASAVTSWRDVARAHGLGRTAIDRMESAFEHADADTAARLASCG